MSLTPDALLIWAKTQQQDTEAGCRAVVSRSYYAAFHHCDVFHTTLPAPGVAAPTGGMHDDLCHRLQQPAPETKDELRIRSKRKASLLRALKHMRVEADYQLQNTVDQADANNAAAKAEQAMKI